MLRYQIPKANHIAAVAPVMNPARLMCLGAGASRRHCLMMSRYMVRPSQKVFVLATKHLTQACKLDLSVHVGRLLLIGK